MSTLAHPDVLAAVAPAAPAPPAPARALAAVPSPALTEDEEWQLLATERFAAAAAHFLALSRDTAQVAAAARVMVEALERGNKVIFCGNGGSAADSQHLAAELMGRFLKDRRPFAAIALTVDTSALTAIGNDYGYEQVFARQLRGVGREGDVLVGISTSGRSENIVLAFEAAAEMGITTVGLLGDQDSPLARLGDMAIQAPSSATPRIQEMHIAIGHTLCELVEAALT